MCEDFIEDIFNGINPDIFIDEFNGTIANIEKIEIMGISKSNTEYLTLLYFDLAEIITRTLNSAIDIELDEVYDVFWNFKFKFKHLRYSPNGPPLKEEIIEEALTYLNLAIVLSKMTEINEMMPYIYFYRAKLENYRGNYWEALNSYSSSLLWAKKLLQKESMREIKKSFKEFNKNSLIKADFINVKNKEKLLSKI
ncbi:MAG: hypothetical protein GF364_18315 [Candidatus Lokiarchaeota archaeon]|nr:hypothetical protein [Candidatus Lokiarchaeota archaeon]